MKNKYIKPLILVVAFLILSLVTVASFAYFSAAVQENDSVYDTVITSGEMALMLNDGEQVGLNNAIPGDSITKEFSIKNTGTVETTYDVYFSELINLFEDKNDLVYTLTSVNGCPNATETVVPESTGDESKIVSSCSINPSQEHEYSLTITFKEDGTAQDDNKGKTFKAKLSINEYNTVAYLSNGNTFNNILSNMIRQATTNNSGFRAKTINRVDQQPDNNIETINIADDKSDEEVLMWIDEDNIKIYTNAKDIYLNSASDNMFSSVNMQAVDLRLFNPSLTTNMYDFFASSQIDEAIVGDYYDTSNVTNMNYMLNYSSFLSYDFLNHFDYSNVETLYKFLGNTTKEIDIELKDINFPKATDFRYMFNGSMFKNIKFTNVEAPSLKDVTMFAKYAKVESIIFENSFNQTSLETINEFAYYSDTLKTFDFGSFNFKKIKEIRQLFMGCKNLSNVNFGTNFDTSNMEKLNYILYGSNQIEEIDFGEKFDTTNVKRISSLVDDCPNLKIIHLGNKFHITPNLDIWYMIDRCPSLTTIYIGPDVEYYPNTSEKIIYQYGEIPSLVGGAGTVYDSTKDTAEYFRIDDPEHGKPGYLTLDPRYQ